MLYHINHTYLWFPVKKNNPTVTLRILHNHVQKQEIDIQLGGNVCDFYACMDVTEFRGSVLEIQANESETLLEHILEKDERPQNKYLFRPKLHFAPKAGWLNDPNGLVYQNGVYHLFYQWNPYGTVWGNMHWGHAVSKDFIHWEHLREALYPDEFGTIYSGCGLIDTHDMLGYGKDALLFYYTAAGGINKWSKEAEHKFIQRLAYSTDEGKNLKKSDKFRIGNITGENRDPKIFYHEPSNAYIMLLYMEGYEFAIFRSKDLINWEETQRLKYQEMWECPDLFELAVDENGSDKKWVFWSADGYYLIGSFDGYAFRPESDMQKAYCGALPYAAQTYHGVKGRTISVSWLRLQNDNGNYRGMMAIPAELSLRTVEDQIKICLWPVRELDTRKQKYQDIKDCHMGSLIPFAGKPSEILLEWAGETSGITEVRIGNIHIRVDFARGKLLFTKSKEHVEVAQASFSLNQNLELSLLVDQEVFEFYGNGGIIYGAVETMENILGESFQIVSTADIKSGKWCSVD